MNYKTYWNNLKIAFKYSFSIAPFESFLIGFLDAITSLVPYATAWLLGYLVNTLIQTVNSSSAFDTKMLWLFIAYALISGVPNLLNAVNIFFYKTWRFKFQEEMEILVLKKRADVDIANYEDPTFQDLYQRAFQRSYWPLLELSEAQFDVIKGLISVVFGSILAVAFSWKIYLILLLFSIPKFFVEYKYGFSVWSIWMKDSPEQRRFADLRSYFMGRARITETKLIQSSEYLLSWIKKILINFNKKQIQAEKSKAFQFVIAEILAMAGFVWAGFLILNNVLEGTILIGSMIYLLTTLSNVRFAFANVLTEIARQGEKHMVVKDLLDFFNTKPIVSRSDRPIKLNLKKPPTIVFENVSFKYQNSSEYSLKNLNLNFEPGKKIGIVGNNGAGKTTLIKLICRIYDPTEGKILINNINLKDIDLEEWWSYLGVMLQDYNQYDFTAKESIAIGRAKKEIDIEKVKEAAKISQSAEFIENWKNQYDEQIGVEFGGKEPSKGQKQKLSIAKILYRNAFVTILDEPTASIDAESEAKIFDSLDNLPESMTAIFISHDFSTISMCDQIVVIESGELKEIGSHQELIEKNGIYKELYNLQASRFK